jgi:diacylglycerol kinase family enzyme
MSNISAVVIVNSKSGTCGTSDIESTLRAMVSALGVTCEIVCARNPSEVINAARQAARSRHDVVIAGGGDGTINAVASELVGTGKRLGVLPLGTFNYFARELGVPTDLESAFRTCFEGEARSVTVGEVNGQIFLNNASIGLYPVIIAVREQTYRRWGRTRWIAYWSVLRALFRLRLNMKLTLTANGERRTIRTPLLFVARNATQLEEFRVPGVRCVIDDGFSVYALRSISRLGLIRVAWRALAGKLEPQYDFDLVCTTSMRVESRRMLRTVAFDGERIKMLSPIEFRVRQNSLSILVPKKREQIAS